MTKIQELMVLVAQFRSEGGPPWLTAGLLRGLGEALPELEALRWIPVEERLPDTDPGEHEWDGNMLLLVDAGGLIVPMIGVWYADSQQWDTEPSMPAHWRVIAWREIGPGLEGAAE